MNFNKEVLGKNIEKYRKERNLTQKKLAEFIGVSQSAIYYWETAKREPDIETIDKLSSALGVTINDLLPGYFDNQAEKMQNTFSFYDYLGKLGYEVHENPFYAPNALEPIGPGQFCPLVIHIKNSGEDIFLSQEEIDELERNTKENIDLRINYYLHDGKHNQ